MTHRIQLIAGVLVACVMTAPLGAQNRADQQVFLDIRLLQSQVQRLQLALNAVTEQLKQTEGRIETQGGAALKGFADQKVQIEAIATGLRTLNERENEGSVRVLQLTQEMKSIREGLQMQQTLLNEILKSIQSTAVMTTPTDPAAAGPPGTTAPPRPGTSTLPPSPGAYYAAAFGFFFGGEYENAISTLTEAIAKFPTFPEAARAQVTIGESHMQLKQDKEALAAFRLAIKTYKDPEAVSDAYYKEAQVYERMGQKDAAKKSLDELIKLYPTSTAALMAPAALKRMGFIK
jgi:TolA-binding protein